MMQIKAPLSSLCSLLLSNIFFILIAVLFISFQGLKYRHLTTEEPQSIHIIEIDPKYLKITPAHAGYKLLARETVKEISESYGAIAAINGSFFESNGRPAGILKINGRWLGLPVKPRGAIGWNQDNPIPLIDQLLVNVTANVLNQSIKIDGLNKDRKHNQMILFSPEFNRTTLTPSKGIELIIREHRVVSIKQQGDSFIPPDSWVLSVGPKHKSFNFWKSVPIDTPIYFLFTILPQSGYTSSKDWNSLSHIVGGTPVLVRRGQPISDFSSEGTRQSFLTSRYARTGVGVLKNGHWIFVVVDGNQPTISIGMTMKEFANLMWMLGSVEALNLDGGGSSTMVINGKIVNDPVGDEDEDHGLKQTRRISDAILMMDKK